LAQILDELDAAGVAFRSATEPFDTATAAGRMLVQMLGVIAEFERATIIDRVIGGMERKAARGEWCGGYRPYGYQVRTTTDKTHILAPHPAEAPLVPVIFDHYPTSAWAHEQQGAKLAELRVRHAELRRALDAVTIQPPTRQELTDLAAQVRVAVSEGPTPARKRLLHTLVHEVQVQGRDAIIPVFRVPGSQPSASDRGVRTMYGSVPPAGLEPALPV